MAMTMLKIWTRHLFQSVASCSFIPDYKDEDWRNAKVEFLDCKKGKGQRLASFCYILLLTCFTFLAFSPLLKKLNCFAVYVSDLSWI